MKFRNLIFVLTIAFSAIFVLMLGTSYAYYLSTPGVPISITTAEDNGIAVIFEQSQYINVNTGVPIYSEDVDELASKSKFTLRPDTTVLTGADVAVNIGIVDIYIDEKLKVEDFKYRFVCLSNNGVIIEESGNGTNFDDTAMSNDYLRLGTLSSMSNTFDVNSTYDCTLSVWLEENDEDQNELMNKKFRGLIKVNTLYTK